MLFFLSKKKRGRMKSILILSCLLGLILCVSAVNARNHPIGEIIYETIHIDYKNLATTPATTILWQPRWPGLWRILWWHFLEGDRSLSTMTAGNYTPGSGKDWANVESAQDGGLVILGDGTNVDAIMTGPYFGNSNIPFNLNPGQNYTVSNQDYLIPGFFIPSAFNILSILDLMEDGYFNATSWDWGYGDDGGILFGGDWRFGNWITPPTMVADASVPSIGYRRNVNPLRAQWAFTTNSILPNEPNDGHLYLSCLVTKIAN